MNWLIRLSMGSAVLTAVLTVLLLIDCSQEPHGFLNEVEVDGLGYFLVCGGIGIFLFAGLDWLLQPRQQTEEDKEEDCPVVREAMLAGPQGVRYVLGVNSVELRRLFPHLLRKNHRGPVPTQRNRVPAGRR